MLPLQVRWERWQWRGILHYSKLQHYWSLTIRLFNVISGHLWEESYPSVEMQSVYSTALANRATFLFSCFSYAIYRKDPMHNQMLFNQVNKNYLFYLTTCINLNSSMRKKKTREREKRVIWTRTIRLFFIFIL